MGKVKDGVPASKAPKPSKGGSLGGDARRRFAQFLVNLGQADLYKPMQGWYARLYTAIGLGVIVGLGVWRLYETVRDASPAARFGVPAAVGAVLGWFIFRLVQYPAVRRVPDRDRSRDEQGLVDQPRRPLPGDHGRPERPSC